LRKNSASLKGQILDFSPRASPALPDNARTVKGHGFQPCRKKSRRRRFLAAAGRRRNRGPHHARCWRDGVGKRRSAWSRPAFLHVSNSAPPHSRSNANRTIPRCEGSRESAGFQPGETPPPKTRGDSPGALPTPENESKESAPHPLSHQGTASQLAERDASFEGEILDFSHRAHPLSLTKHEP